MEEKYFRSNSFCLNKKNMRARSSPVDYISIRKPSLNILLEMTLLKIKICLNNDLLNYLTHQKLASHQFTFGIDAFFLHFIEVSHALSLYESEQERDMAEEIHYILEINQEIATLVVGDVDKLQQIFILLCFPITKKLKIKKIETNIDIIKDHNIKDKRIINTCFTIKFFSEESSQKIRSFFIRKIYQFVDKPQKEVYSLILNKNQHFDSIFELGLGLIPLLLKSQACENIEINCYSDYTSLSFNLRLRISDASPNNLVRFETVTIGKHYEFVLSQKKQGKSTFKVFSLEKKQRNSDFLNKNQQYTDNSFKKDAESDENAKIINLSPVKVEKKNKDVRKLLLKLESPRLDQEKNQTNTENFKDIPSSLRKGSISTASNVFSIVRSSKMKNIVRKNKIKLLYIYLRKRRILPWLK